MIIRLRSNQQTTGSILCFAVVFIMIFAEHYLNLITLPSIFYTVVSIAVFFVFSPQNATQYFIMLIPFANALHIKEISIFYLIIVFFKSSITKQGVRIRTSTACSFIAVLFLQLIAGLRCDDNIATLVYLAFVMGCVIYWTVYFFEEEQCYTFLKLYLISLLCMVLFMIALTIKIVPLKQLISGFVRLGEDSYFKTEAFHTGANGLGMMCLFATSIICFLLSRKKIGKMISISMIVVFLFAGIMTQSRAFIFGCVFLVLYLMLFYAKSIVRWLKFIVIIGVLGIVVILLINAIYPNILLHFVERFSVNDVTNGRTGIMQGYFRSIFKDPISLFFGAGLLTYPTVLGADVNYVSSHNATQEVMLAWGFFGLIAIIVWFISLVMSRNFKNCKDSKMAMLLPLFMLIFMVQSTRIFSTYSSIFLVGISMFCITSSKKGSN